MLQGMDQSEFGQFVAALWERQGWQTQIKRDDGRVFVAVQRPQTGEEGLIWALPDEGEVGGKHVQQFSSVCEEYEVAESAIVTAGSLSDHAEKVAEGTGVELLDGEGLASVLNRKGLTDLASQYGGRSGADGGRGGDGGSGADGRGESGAGGEGQADGGGNSSPLDQLRAMGSRASALISGVLGDVSIPVSGTTVVVVVLVALLGAGFLSGVPIPFLGGDGGPISAASASPNNSTSTLHVEWNAAVVDEIDPNESDGQAYYPPEGEQFVVVRLSINNTGNRSVKLKQEAFDLRTERGTQGHQALADHDGFMDFPISPGQHYVGWTVFRVPEGTTGTLVYDQNETDAPVAVEFERNKNLAVNVSQQ